MWKWLQSKRRGWSWLRGVRVASLTVAAGFISLALFGGELEEVYGVGALFRLRGRAPTPPDIVVVAIDHASAVAFGFPGPPFPRSYHAQLVTKLAQYGARAIIFDVTFLKESEPQTKEFAETEEFAKAIQSAEATPV